MSGLIEKINDIIFKTDYYRPSSQDEMFRQKIKSHKLGDVIWATRYDFNWEKDFYEEGHDIGPYVVLKVLEDRLLCVFCTGSSNKRGAVKLDEYPFFYKDTFLHKRKLKVVDKESYCEGNYYNTYHLNKEDIDKILKAYKFNNESKKYYDNFGVIEELELNSAIELDVGDVVTYDNYIRVIVNKTSKGLEGIVVDFFNSKNGVIDLKDSNIHYDKTCIIDPSKVNYLNTISKNQLLIILKRYREYLEKNNDIINGVLKRGSVIKMNNEYYYVYNINSNIAYLHHLYKTDYGIIVIEDDLYRESYEDELTLDINDKYNVVHHLSEKELDVLRNKRKNHNKSNNNKKNIKQKDKSRFDICSIIENKKMIGIRYLVLGYNDNKIITIVFDAFLGGNIIYKEFDKNDLNIEECKRVDVVDIEAIKENMLNFENLFKEKTLLLDK